MSNVLIKPDSIVHTYDYSGDIGSLLVEAGLEPASEFSVDFHTDGMDEVRIDSVHDENNEILWNSLDRTLRWSDRDDEIVEALESWIYNNWDGR